MERRNFLRVGGISAAMLALWRQVLYSMDKRVFQHQSSGFWKGDYFHQKTVDTSRVRSGLIRAKVGGKWREYELKELNDAFMSWNTKDRLANLETMKGGKMPDWSGAHNAAVATFGKNRGDSLFTLNNAIKGTGLCPKEERLPELIDRLKSTQNNDYPEKFAVLESLYQDDSLWDRKKLISLELYVNPDFETHTFLNQMENPVSTIVYLDIPSYEIRTIARLLHPADPDLDPYEKNMVSYINTIHSYMHSHFTDIVPAVLYHVIEVFDNSPAGRGGEGKRGERIL